MSCAKKAPLETAKKYFDGQDNCLEVLKKMMEKSNCTKMNFKHLGPNDIMIRCYKPDEERGEFWDNYIFRMSPPNLRYNSQDQEIINQHTLCVDAGMRLEAYPYGGIK